MAYKSFSFEDIENKLGVNQVTGTLFANAIISNVEVSERIQAQVNMAFRTALTTEKAISERLISPILLELQMLNEGEIEVFSGENLIGDKKIGLNGECDFIIARAPGSKYLKAPIISITEAKKGDIDNAASLAQNVAQMIGARYFNQQRNTNIDTIYGSVTSGMEWLFLKLEGNTITIDTKRYSANQLQELLNILNFIVKK
jgi:hypothetical protein